MRKPSLIRVPAAIARKDTRGSRSPWTHFAGPGRAVEQTLLRGPERDLKLSGDAGRRIEREVPGLGRNARVAEEVRIVGLTVHDIAVDVEDLCSRRSEVRILRLRRPEMGARDVHVRMTRTGGTGPAAAGRMPTAQWGALTRSPCKTPMLPLRLTSALYGADHA